MNTHSYYFDERIRLLFSDYLKARNDLEINSLEIVNIQNRNKMIVVIGSNCILDPEVNVFIAGPRLIIEAVKIKEYDKPLKTHLLEGELLNEFENGGLDIGISEVKLSLGYTYKVISTTSIAPGLLKVVLTYQAVNGPQRNDIN